MKSANVKIRRMTAVVLMLLAGLLMCITGLLPSEARAEETSTTTSTTSNQFSNILDLGSTKPEGLDDANTTPYGTKMNQQFLLSEQNELLLQTSHDTNNGNNNSNNQWNYYDTIENGNFSFGDTSQSFGSELDSLSFPEAIAYDPTGSGRKDHIAYIGFDGTSKTISMYVVNTTNNSVSETKQLADAKWLYNTSPAQYQAMNFFSITAGDYDNDGQESVVVYLCGDSDNISVSEMIWKDDVSEKPYLQTQIPIKSPLHPYYRTLSLYESESQNYKLGVSLTTGDINGDGVDDLAAVSYCNNIGDSVYKDNNAENHQLLKPYLWFGYGSEGATLDELSESGLYIRDRDTADTPYEPSISAGDVDGDGKDEIVMAGHTCDISKSDSYSVSSSETMIRWYGDGDQSNPINIEGFDKIDANKLSKQSGGNNGDASSAPVVTACVAINGQNAAEYAFINGILYTLDSNLNKVTEEEQLSYLDNITGVWANLISGYNRMMIQSVAVGNFDGNDAGREQIYCTIGAQKSYDDYIYLIDGLAGTNYKDETDSDGNIISYGSASSISPFGMTNNVWKSSDDNKDKFTGTIDETAYGSGTHQRLSCMVVAFDNDNDGIMAKYVEKGYTYSDPQVTAVLQAAPWFDELGSYGDFQGETTYGITQKYGSGSTSSNSGSVGVGLSAEVTAGGVTAAIETGYLRGYTQEFEESVERSYTSEFTAGAQDSIVINRIPIYLYTYEVSDSIGRTQYLTFSVPQQPTYFQMSVNEYNNFVNEFNTELKDTETDKQLKQLNSKYLGNEGNPFGYRSSWTGNDYPLQLSDMTTAIAYNGSMTGSKFSTDTTTKFGTASSNTYSTTASLSFGYDDPTGLFGLEVGVSTSVEKSTSNGQYTTIGSVKETSGKVYNIDQQSLLRNSQIPYSTSGKYGFNWTYGMWAVDLNSNEINSLVSTSGTQENKAPNSFVPVYGYVLSSIKSPAPPVTDLAAELDSTSSLVKLSWSKPDTASTGRSDITGYNIYQVEENGEYTKVNEDALSEAETSFEIDGLTSNTTYYYVVTAINKDGESVYSNEASVTTPKQNLAVSLKVVDSATGLPSEGATITANHLGNVAISDGDLVPETSIINVGITAADGNTIDSITMTSGSDSSTMPASFSFSLKEPTEIVVKVTGEPVVTVTESKVSYQARTIDADDKDMTPGSTGGSVTAAIGNVPLSSGGKVAMPNTISFNATANEGYVLKEWRIYRSSDDYTNDENPVIRPNDGTMSLSYSPTTDTTIVTPIFIDVNNPAAYKTVTIDQTTGGTVTASDASGQALVPDENGQIKVFTGNTVTFTAEAADYYNFTGWAENIEGAGTENPTTLNVTQDITAKASFVAPVTYTVEYEGCTAKAGDVTVKNGSSQIPGTEVTFTAPAVEGKYVSQWIITDNGAGTSETIDTPVDEIIESVGQGKTCTLTVTHNISVKPVYAERTTISNVNVDLTVIANSNAQTRFVDTANHYTAEITWSPELVDGKFDYDTIYTAAIVVTPESALYQIDATGSGYKVSGSTDGVTCSNGSTESITMTKTFEKTDRDYSVKGVTISQDSLTIDSAGDAQLTAAVTPDYATKQSINWTSSDDSVATVDQNGKVTAHKAGTATITAASEENSSISADCIVTVINPTVTYRAHVQNYGWLSDVTNGAQAGTTGQALQMEAIVVNAATSDGTRIPLKIDAHLADIGWINDNTDNRIVGTTGQYRRLEAVRIYINDSELDAKYDIYYRMHVRNYGWMNWEKDGGVSGTTGQALRAEAIEIMILPAGQTPE